MDIALLGAVLAACVLCLLEKKKAQIFEAVWSIGSESCQSSVTNVICNLRKKIEPDSRNAVFIPLLLSVYFYTNFHLCFICQYISQSFLLVNKVVYFSFQ